MNQVQNSSPSENHRIFEDPAIAQSLKEDPVLRFLKNHFREIAVVIAAVVAVSVARDRFQATRAASLDEGAKLYSAVSEDLKSYRQILTDLREKEQTPPTDKSKQEEYDKSLQELKTKRDQAATLLNDRLTALADQREPYRDFAPLYRALMATAEGKDQAGFSFSDGWEQAEGAERMIQESGALERARLLLDSSNPSQGRALLTVLAERGQYVAVPAAASLARSSQDAAERAESRAVIEKIQQQHPEQQELLSAELVRLK